MVTVVTPLAGFVFLAVVAALCYRCARGRPERVFLSPEDEDADSANLRRVVVVRKKSEATRIRHSFFVAYRRLSFAGKDDD